MKLLRIILRFIRPGLLGLLLLYWAVFVTGSIVTLVSGGPAGVAQWYRHVFPAHLVGGNCAGDTCTFTIVPSILNRGWGRFWAIQFFYLVCTLILCFFERHSFKKNDQQERN